MSWLIGISLFLLALTGYFCVGTFRACGFGLKLKRLIAGSLCGSLAALVAAGWFLLYAFEVFTGETLIAQVSVEKLKKQEFRLTYTPIENGRLLEPKNFVIRGDQWAISGGLVKWSSWLAFLGLKSYHKPMRIGGQYSDLKQQQSYLPTVYALAPGVDRVWEGLYWVSGYLPFVEAVYGSSAYVYAEADALYEIYVSPYGYLIKVKRSHKHTTNQAHSSPSLLRSSREAKQSTQRKS